METVVTAALGGAVNTIAALCEFTGGKRTFISLLFSGLSIGSIAALAALGFLLMQKATGVISFAQGDMITLGAYIAIWWMRDRDAPWLLAYVLTLVMMFGIGIVLERVAYAPLKGRSIHVVVIATLGAALVIRAIIALWQDTTPTSLFSPLKGRDPVKIGGAAIPPVKIAVFVVTLVVVAVMIAVFNRTQFGRQVRAIAADRETARMHGVAATKMSMIAFGLSTALAGLAGILIGPTQNVDLTLGFGAMLAGFSAAILGGFGSLGGVVIGGFMIGLSEQIVGGYCLSEYKSAFPYVLMLIVIAVRPQGLFSRGAAHGRL